MGASQNQGQHTVLDVTVGLHFSIPVTDRRTFCAKRLEGHERMAVRGAPRVRVHVSSRQNRSE